MGRVSSVRGGLLALATACALLGANLAWAQTSPPPSSVTLSPVINHSVPRDGYRTNDQLNYSDCVNDDVITFLLLLSDGQSSTLQVWAGTQCDDFASRTTAGSAQCWLLASLLPTSDNQLVSIHLRDLLAGRTLSASTQAFPLGTLVSGTGAEACIDSSGLAVVSQITLYFMLVDGSNAGTGTVASWTARYKLIGPPPPDLVTATPAPVSLDLKFAYIMPTSDSTFNGYQFYCDPAPGADAGASTAACDDLTQTQTLVPGGGEDNNALCGEAAVTSASGIAEGLESGVPYHVAVAAVDTFENLGRLSVLACGIPKSADHSDETSRACGCAVPGSLRRGALPVLGFVMALLGVSRRRRRRRV